MAKTKLIILIFVLSFLASCKNYTTEFNNINIPKETLVMVSINFLIGHTQFTAKFESKEDQFLVLKRYDNEEYEGEMILMPSPGYFEAINGGEKIFICKDDVLAIQYVPDTEDNFIYISPELFDRVRNKKD